MLLRPPEQKLPVSEMFGTQLENYRRALVRYLRRCVRDDSRYQEQRGRLAEVLAEEQARRQDGDITVMVPRLHL
jgi:hypothetical protein